MSRNLDHRVEAVTPVEDPRIRRQLKFNLELLLADTRRRWVMNADGSYDQRRHEEDGRAVDTQQVLMEVASRAATEGRSTDGVPCSFPIEGDLLIE